MSRIASILDTLEQPWIKYSFQGWNSCYVCHCGRVAWGIEDSLSFSVSHEKQKERAQYYDTAVSF